MGDSSQPSLAESHEATAAPSRPKYLIGTAAYLVYGEKCKSARKAVVYFRQATWRWQAARGASLADATPMVRGKTCRWARISADVWQKRAQAAKGAYRKWSYDYAWWLWMPAKHQRVARCETGYQGGDGPGGSRFDWDSGLYVSAFGIIRAGYAQFAHALGFLSWDESISRQGHPPTPREQMLVASALQARYGWGAWGCGGA